MPSARFAIQAPLAALYGPHLLGEFVDPAADLLAIGARREVRNQIADLLRVEAQP